MIVCHPGGMDEGAEPNVTISVDVSAALEGIWKCRSAAFFALHEDLTDLDDELDILYRGQL